MIAPNQFHQIPAPFHHFTRRGKNADEPERIDFFERQGGELRRLVNTSGKDYREQKLGALLPTLPPAAALARLADNGNLVKRPFLLGPGVALTGFDPAAWRAALLSR